MSDMEKAEIVERFSEGMKKAASRCRELAKVQANQQWLHIANSLDDLRKKGELMYSQKALSRGEVLEMLSRRVDKKVEKGKVC